MDKRLLALIVVAAGGVVGFSLAATFITFGQSDPGEPVAIATTVGTPEVDLHGSFAHPKVAGTPVRHQWTGEAWRPIMGDQNWQKYVVEDPNSTAVTDEAQFLAFLAGFQDFPLYWVGLDFQGLPLTGMSRYYTPDTAPPQDHVVLLYGTCRAAGDEGGCSVPLQIRIEPYCYAQAGMYAPEVRKDTLQVRGASAQYIGGALRLWMGPVSVRVSAWPEERMEQAAAALVTANGRGPTASDQTFPALNADCSGFTLEPYFAE